MGHDTSKEHINETMNNIVGQTKPAAIEEAEKLLDIKRNQIFIEDDSAIANPYSFLGRVIEIRKIGGKCPESYGEAGYTPEWSTLPIPGRKVDENSKIKSPERAKTFIVEKNVATKVAVLQYFSGEIDANSAYDVIVFNQATGMVDVHDDSWAIGVEKWRESNKHLLDDTDICFLLVVTGMVQKNILRKKFVKFESNAKGGYFGVNINGELYTSTEDYSLDIRFGLTVNVIKRPHKEESIAKEKGLFVPAEENFLLDKPKDAEIELFQSIRQIKGS